MRRVSCALVALTSIALGGCIIIIDDRDRDPTPDASIDARRPPDATWPWPWPDAPAYVDAGVDAGSAQTLVIEGACPAGAQNVVAVTSSLSGGELVVDASHGGGCGRHEYHVCWDGRFWYADPSNAQAILELRDVTTDPCDALLSPRFRIDVNSVKAAYQAQLGRDHGRIELRFQSGSPRTFWDF